MYQSQDSTLHPPGVPFKGLDPQNPKKHKLDPVYYDDSITYRRAPLMDITWKSYFSVAKGSTDDPVNKALKVLGFFGIALTPFIYGEYVWLDSGLPDDVVRAFYMSLAICAGFGFLSHLLDRQANQLKKQNYRAAILQMCGMETKEDKDQLQEEDQKQKELTLPSLYSSNGLQFLYLTRGELMKRIAEAAIVTTMYFMFSNLNQGVGKDSVYVVAIIVSGILRYLGSLVDRLDQEKIRDELGKNKALKSSDSSPEGEDKIFTNLLTLPNRASFKDNAFNNVLGGTVFAGVIASVIYGGVVLNELGHNDVMLHISIIVCTITMLAGLRLDREATAIERDNYLLAARLAYASGHAKLGKDKQSSSSSNSNTLPRSSSNENLSDQGPLLENSKNESEKLPPFSPLGIFSVRWANSDLLKRFSEVGLVGMIISSCEQLAEGRNIGGFMFGSFIFCAIHYLGSWKNLNEKQEIRQHLLGLIKPTQPLPTPKYESDAVLINGGQLGVMRI